MSNGGKGSKSEVGLMPLTNRSVHDQVSRNGLGYNPSCVRRRVISRQKLRQIVRRKGSKMSSRLRRPRKILIRSDVDPRFTPLGCRERVWIGSSLSLPKPIGSGTTNSPS